MSMIGSPAVITPPTVLDRRLKNRAVLRRANVGALELILGRHLALDEFADLAVGFAQVLGDVAGEFLINLDDLQLGLETLPLACAAAAMSWPRSPCSRASSRSSEVSRVIGIRFFAHKSRTPWSSWLMNDDFLGLGVLLRGQPGHLFAATA